MMTKNDIKFTITLYNIDYYVCIDDKNKYHYYQWLGPSYDILGGYVYKTQNIYDELDTKAKSYMREHKLKRILCH